LCDWSDESYAALKARIETVPEGPLRAAALKAIERLAAEPYGEGAASAQEWHGLAAESQQSAETYRGEEAKTLIRIGCDAWGAPYIISGLLQQLPYRFECSALAEVVRGFLDEANCPGAGGLSGESKARLREMRCPESPQPSPGAASR
jgi:hypothetical protein